MNLVEVDIVGLQPAQTSFALLDNMATAVAGRIRVAIRHRTMNFGCKHDLLALAITLERRASYLFTAPTAVDIGCI